MPDPVLLTEDGAYLAHENAGLWRDESGGIPIARAVSIGAPFSSAASPNINYPAGMLEHDLIIAFMETLNAQAVPAWSGSGDTWADLTAFDNATAGTRITVRWMRRGVADPTTVLAGDPGDHILGQLVAFRNARRTDSPFNTEASGGFVTEAEASGTAVTFPSFDPSGTDTLIVFAGAVGTDTNTPQLTAWTSNQFSDPAISTLVNTATNLGGGGALFVGCGGWFVDTATGTINGTLATAAAKALVTMALVAHYEL